MMGINKVILVGNLGGDPETKKTASGQTITLFNVATSNNWVNKEGQKQEHTEWHRIVVWGKLAETCGEYLAKGRKVEGRLQTRSWEDDKGQKRYTTEVVAAQVLFLSANNAQAGTQERKPTGGEYKNEPAFGSGQNATNPEEELPF
ncbi:MAG: single-stranded DNA-binding protein [Bdellovibrionales bacterium]